MEKNSILAPAVLGGASEELNNPFKTDRSSVVVPRLELFAEKYIPAKMQTNWHHRLMYDILSNKVIQKSDGKFYLNTYSDSKPNKINNNIQILAPRFHAKSQIITINYILWEIYKNPNVRIMIVSANEDIAVSFCRAIINHLENNQKLIEELGSLVPVLADKKKWGERAVIVKRDTFEKDPTIAAVGLGGAMISKRADIIVCDDIIDLNTARTKQSRKKTLDWFENVLIPILEDSGRIVIAGTSWYKGDIYDSIMLDSNFDIRLKLKALIYDDRYYNKQDIRGSFRYMPYDIMDFPMIQKAQDIFSQEILDRYSLYERLKGGVLWQEKWPYENLMKKKSNMSEASFNRQYLNEPTSDQDKPFKEWAINEAKRNGDKKSLLPKWNNAEIPDGYKGYGDLIIAIGVDLAISKSEDADQSAIAVWGIDGKRRRILLWLDFGKWSPDEIKQRVIDAYYNFNPVKIRVENIAYQDMMRQEISNDEIPVEGFSTTSSKKFNEETGLAQIAMLAEQGKLVIPASRSNKEYWDRVRALIAEMTTYTYDQHAGDILMASWFAIHTLNAFDRKLSSNRGYFSATSIIDNMKSMRAAHRVFVINSNPPVFKFSPNSLLYVYRQVDHPKDEEAKMFFQPDEKFMIFVTRETRSVGYIFKKATNEIVGKIDGDISMFMLVNMLDRVGRFFNNAQIIVDLNGEGGAVNLELQHRFYPNLICMQPDGTNRMRMASGFTIDKTNLPLSIDYFKMRVEKGDVILHDDPLIKEMSELISVQGDTLTLSHGSGQRIKTMATGIWLLDHYENREKKLYNNSSKTAGVKKKKALNVPYKVFQKNYGRTH